MHRKSANETKRANMYLPVKLLARVDGWARDNGTSRTAAIETLLMLGLDSDSAGLETALAMHARTKKELQSLRGLIVASIDAADTGVAMQVLLAGQRDEIKHGEAKELYRQAREAGRKLKRLKHD